MAEVSPYTSLWDVITSGTMVSGIVGLISGAIGSLIAPWSVWGVEKQRAKRQYRVEQVTRWRKALHGDLNRRSFVSSEAYSTLKPYMPKRLAEEIERSRNPLYIVALPRDGDDLMRSRLLEVVAERERKWKLLY